MDKITQAVQRAQNANGTRTESAHDAPTQAFPSLSSAVLQELLCGVTKFLPAGQRIVERTGGYAR